MTVYTVWIVNKSGGLAYQRTIHEGFHPRLSSNDYLVLASTFQRYGEEEEEGLLAWGGSPAHNHHYCY